MHFVVVGLLGRQENDALKKAVDLKTIMHLKTEKRLKAVEEQHQQVFRAAFALLYFSISIVCFFFFSFLVLLGLAPCPLLGIRALFFCPHSRSAEFQQPTAQERRGPVNALIISQLAQSIHL